jgi:hypothetical protein
VECVEVAHIVAEPGLLAAQGLDDLLDSHSAGLWDMSEIGGPLESVDLHADGDVLADGRFGLDDRHSGGC